MSQIIDQVNQYVCADDGHSQTKHSIHGIGRSFVIKPTACWMTFSTTPKTFGGAPSGRPFQTMCGDGFEVQFP